MLLIGHMCKVLITRPVVRRVVWSVGHIATNAVAPTLFSMNAL